MNLRLDLFKQYSGTSTLLYTLSFPILAGWAFADSVLHRLAPLWVGARGLEFTWDYLLQGLEANANLVGPFVPMEFYLYVSPFLGKLDSVSWLHSYFRC